jgi:hypothetical protein
MDPNATLRAIQDAWTARDYETARERALDLIAWLERGGCVTVGATRSGLYAYARQMLRATRRATGPRP